MKLKIRSASWLVVMIASLAIVAGCAGGETTVTVTAEAPEEFEDAPVAGEPAEETELETETEEEVEDPDTTVYEIGSTATDDGLEVRVKTVETVDSVPIIDDWANDGPITASKGAKLVRADVVWKNTGKTSVLNFCGGQGAKLIDSEGREFDSHDRQYEASPTGCGDEVQPGFKAEDILVFELPADATPDVLKIWDSNSEDDFFGETFVLFGPIE